MITEGNIITLYRYDYDELIDSQKELKQLKTYIQENPNLIGLKKGKTLTGFNYEEIQLFNNESELIDSLKNLNADINFDLDKERNKLKNLVNERNKLLNMNIFQFLRWKRSNKNN